LIIRMIPLTSRISGLAVFELATINEQDGTSIPRHHWWWKYSRRPIPQAHGRKAGRLRLPRHARSLVISPEARTVEVLHLQDSFPHRMQILARGELTPKLSPRVKINISSIWPD
jgi:hypothetical protein